MLAKVFVQAVLQETVQVAKDQSGVRTLVRGTTSKVCKEVQTKPV